MIKKFALFLLITGIGFTDVVALAAQSGEIAPGCDAITQKTGAQGLETYRGKVIYLDFWATWCPPCRKSMPALNRLHNELASSGFEILAINVDEKQEDAEQYLRKYPVDYPIVFDPKANCPKTYQLKGMPSAYLIDRDGVIQEVHIGFRQGDIKQIRAKIMALLETEDD